MNKQDHELRVKVHSAVYFLIKEKGFASAVDVLMSLGFLSKFAAEFDANDADFTTCFDRLHRVATFCYIP